MNEINKTEIVKENKDSTKEESQTSGKRTNGKPQSKNKSKSRKSNYKGNYKQTKSKGINDPDWYIPSEQIAKDTANIPFNVYAGLNYRQEVEAQRSTSGQFMSTNGISALYQSVPGLVIFKYLPSIGTSTNRDSAINIAGHAMFAFIRSMNSGAKNYEASDVTMYVLGAEQIYLMIQEAARVFVAAQEYTYTSRLIPEKLVKALGFDIRDLQSNLADYRRRINVMIQQINTFSVPNEFNLIKRRSVLASTILMDDADTPKQLIIPESDGYYTFNPTAFTTGGALIYTSKDDIGTACVVNTPSVTSNRVPGKFTKTLRTFNTLLDYIQNAIRAFTRNTDQNTISGDILKAYGAENCFKINEITSDHRLEMLHDVDLLEQFKNSVVLDVPGATLNSTTTTCQTERPGLLQQELYPNVLNSKILFRCPAPTGVQTQNILAYYSVTPVITQINDNIVFEASLPTATHTAGSMNQDATWYLRWNTMTTAGVAPKSSLILDSFKSDIDFKLVLEYTRFMMMIDDVTTHNNDRPNTLMLCAFETVHDDDLFTNKVSKVRTYLSPNSPQTTIVTGNGILAGTEIGLGWLVVAQDNLVAQMIGEPISNTSQLPGVVLVQWFQNHTNVELVHGNAPASNKSTLANDLRGNSVSTVIHIYKTGSTSYEIINDAYIHNIMLGLDFSPRPYNVGTFNDGSNSGSFALTTWLYYTSGKFGNKTGIVAKSNLRALHDTALIGLISKRAYERVSSKQGNKR